MSSVIDPTGAIGLAATEREPAAAPAQDPGTAPEPAVAPVFFALTPAQAVPDLYDYGKAKDAKIYKAATDPLTTKHNGNITTLRPMLDELLMRVKDFNWTSLVEIQDNNRKTFKNVILQNRALTIENVSASAVYLGSQTRAAQDNYMMVQCILNSLDTDGAKALRSSQYSYLINGEACGALLIKVLFLDCEVETAATNFFVRAQLGDLEQHMVAIEYDVLEFNKHVSELLRKLRQGGEESNDDVLFIYMHVMRAYLICPDPDFLLAIKLQKLKAETDPKLLTLPILMITAQKAYQTLMQEGTYNSPQSHESRLIALAAKFGGAKTTDVSDAYPKNRQSKGKDKGKRAEWMTIAPKDNVITKVVEGKTYHYCPHHKRWGFHQEKDCFVKLKRLADTANTSSVTTPSSGASATSTQGSSDSSSRLTMSAAIAAVLDDEDDDNGSYSAFPSLISSAATTKNKKQTPTLASFDSDSFTILVDNGASRCMTNNVKHFVSIPTVVNKVVKGLGAGKVTMEGTVRWSWEDDLGACHTFDIPNTLYCADLAYCLLSPQHLAAERQDNVPNERGTWLATYDDAMVLHWGQQMFLRTIKLSSNNAYVGLMRSAPGYRKSNKFLSLCALQLPITALCFPAPVYHAETTMSEVINQPDDDTPPTALDPDEDYNWVLLEAPARHEPLRFDFNPDHPGEPPTHNVDHNATDISTMDTSTSPQFDADKQDLLTLHHRLGHMPFNQIRHMLSLKATPASKRMIDCQLPVCSACLFGKACKRAWRTKATNDKIKIAAAPGDVVSMDQLESSTPGLIAHAKGKPTTKRFTCATVFVDHFSRLTYIHLQESTGAVETLAAKHAFERFAKTNDVIIKHYHGDNGRFSENAFRNDCNQQGQRLTFCGVNAHFQNGIAERRIRDLQDRARTMIVHAKHRWPDAITSNLWPYALRLANEGSQCIPIKEGKNPLQLFTGHDFQVAPHQHLHPFGCPMYVLKHGPASGRKGPKWGERARCGIYLGLSPEHARSVCLVLSLTTGMVSPQFHVKADEHFETVGPNSPSTASVYQSLWQYKHGFANETNGGGLRRRELPALTHNVRHIPPLPRFQPRQPRTRSHLPPKSLKTAPDHLINRLPPPLAAPPTRHRPDSDSDTDGDDEQPLQVIDQLHVPSRERANAPAGPHVPAAPLGIPVVTPLPAPAIPRARRSTRPPRRLIAEAATIARTPPLPPIFQEDPESFLHDMGEYMIQDSLHDPFAFSASADPDTMYLHEARRQPDWPEFQMAMREEVLAHESRRHWKLVKRAAIPEGVKVLPSVWSMKRKRRIATREIYKWKARLNAHGGKQVQGINFWETYSPVVNWTSIRLHLILALLSGHRTRQIDFILAYPQADAECDMYMEIPQGFHHEGHRRTHVLKLLKNIYGTRQAGRVWNKHLHAGLMERGYVQSTVDHCVYYKDNTVFLLYVDDGIFIGPDDEQIDALIASLKHDPNCQTAYDITDEGDLSDYLGVKVDHLEGGRIQLSQPHLIQQIIDDLGFQENTKPKKTPAPASTVLNRDVGGKDFEEPWSYRSVVGKLNFLEKSTRADLSYAVHQCARFAACPKESHAEAIRHIGRYLVGTRDKGIILEPSEHSFDCYVDADFCGNWNPDTAEGDASTSKSRTGFVIKYAGCPIVWQSKLQTETALSTTEAEYIALSAALREVISLMDLLKEAKNHGIPNVVAEPRIHCKVFEDNSGALAMAQVPKMRPRTKHLNVKYHHFRSHVANGNISLHAVASADQEADIYTKPLPLNLFTRLRLAILGW